MRITTKELSKDPVLNRILDLLKQQKKTEKDLINYLGLANGTFTGWKYKGQNTFLKNIGKMSEYFDVSPNYLLRGIDDEINVQTLSIQEIKLVQGYRRMNDLEKKNVMETVLLFNQSKNEEKR